MAGMLGITGVFSYAMIARCCPNSKVFFFFFKAASTVYGQNRAGNVSLVITLMREEEETPFKDITFFILNIQLPL